MYVNTCIIPGLNQCVNNSYGRLGLGGMMPGLWRVKVFQRVKHNKVWYIEGVCELRVQM
jgi:hypothetical protein